MTQPAREGSPLLEVLRSALDPLLAQRLRSLVTVAALAALLAPFLVSTALFTGLRDAIDAAASARPDVVVTCVRLGRSAPIPPALVDAVRALDGVDRVTPRVVVPVRIGKDELPALLVGMDRESAPLPASLRGHLPSPGPGHELVFGEALARALGVDVGDAIPPFYRNPAGERVSTVVGVLEGGAPWQQSVVLASFATADHVADGGGAATDLLVTCRPGYGDAVAQAAARIPVDGAALRAVRGDAAAAALLELPSRTHTVFDAHLVLAFALGIPILLVTSGVGLAARRREAGLLRALGWTMESLLVRGLAEGALLAVAGASLATLVAAAWLGPLRGVLVADLYLPGLAPYAESAAPWRLAPGPVLVGAGVALILTLTGSVVSVWRTAVASPAEAMT